MMPRTDRTDYSILLPERHTKKTKIIQNKLKPNKILINIYYEDNTYGQQRAYMVGEEQDIIALKLIKRYKKRSLIKERCDVKICTCKVVLNVAHTDAWLTKCICRDGITKLYHMEEESLFVRYALAEDQSFKAKLT